MRSNMSHAASVPSIPIKLRPHKRPVTLSICGFSSPEHVKTNSFNDQSVSCSSLILSDDNNSVTNSQNCLRELKTKETTCLNSTEYAPIVKSDSFMSSVYSRHSFDDLTMTNKDTEINQPTTVLPYLVLGCHADAMSEKVCSQFGITHVINVSVDCKASPHVSSNNFLRIPILDNFSAKMEPYFDKAFELLNSAKKSGGCVLIHCFAGISRSPTLAIAYLMLNGKQTMREAYNQVKQIRPSVSPNFNFLGQLVDFERKLFNHSSSDSNQNPDIVPRKSGTSSLIPPSLPSTSSCAQNSIGLSLKQSLNESNVRREDKFRLSIRRPSLKVDGKKELVSLETCPVNIGPKKRERPHQLSLFSPPILSPTRSVRSNPFDLNSVDTSNVFTDPEQSFEPVDVSRRKRSRVFFTLPKLIPDNLISSPSSAIAHLDLSSPSDDLLKRLSSNNRVSHSTQTDVSMEQSNREKTESQEMVPVDNYLVKSASPLYSSKNLNFSHSYEKLYSCGDNTLTTNVELSMSSSDHPNSFEYKKMPRSRHFSSSSIFGTLLEKSASNPMLSSFQKDQPRRIAISSSSVLSSPKRHRTDFPFSSIQNWTNFSSEASCRLHETCNRSSSSSLSSSGNSHNATLHIS